MPLIPGTRLGPYEITAPLGAGGMGEVYRAKDSRLGREVAIKVLPQHLSQNPELRARFEREARTVSFLNHPYICTLHDVGREGETDYLVMELVEGETLAQRLAKGPLPAADALKLGAQIADALDRAHRAGVIHRDLKPGNVMLTKSGAKLMDFGLARATGLAGPAGASGLTHAALTRSPTVAGPLTSEGSIVGTFQYMSPEQLEGKEADARSDIWALGCVLYEMATASQAFAGASQASLIASILKDQPRPLSEFAPLAPPEFERLVKQCLAKDPDERWQTASDLKRELRWIGESGTHPKAESPLQAAGRRGAWLPIAVLAAGLLAGAYIGWGILPRKGGRAAGTSIAGSGRVTSVAQLTDRPGRETNPNLSPDGRSLLYVSASKGVQDIFLMRVGGENPVNLTAGSGASNYDPAFSPDGERIAFCSSREGGGIFVMGATGESPRKLVGAGAHPSWSPDGRRLVYSTEHVSNPYARSTTASLWVVDLATGATRRIFAGDAVQPSWSPSGRRIAFFATEKGQRDIWTIPAEGGQPVAVTHDVAADWDPFWASDGHSLYFLSDRGGSRDLWRVAIDEGTGRARGEPEPITTGVTQVMAGSISADGRRVAVEVDETRSEILKLDFDPVAGRPRGEPVSVFASSNSMTQLDVSGDGGWVAYRTSSHRENIFVMRSDGTERRRLTDDEFRNRGPRWIRGSDWLTYYSNRGGSYQVWLMRRDGTEMRVLTNRSASELNQPAVSVDGRRMAVGASAGASNQLGLLDVDDSWFTPGKALVPATIDTVADEFDPSRWSPDGKCLSGSANTPHGFVPAIYWCATHRLEPRTELAGLSLFGMTWLPDSRRALCWDAMRNTAVLWDTGSRELRDVAGIPGPSEMKLSEDGHLLVLNRSILDGDIWLLTLDK